MKNYKDLVYGNINKEATEFLKMNNIFTNYFNEFSNTPFNDFFASSEEITTIIKTQREAEQNKNWEKIKKFNELCDGDMTKTLRVSLKKINIPYDDAYIEYLTKVSMELGGLIMQLKEHYQRPRPYQIAYYSNQPLNPYETISGNTPAYPSGHATQGRFLTKLIASHYPKKRIELSKLSERISNSRIVMGLHYPSDNLFGERIASALLEKEDIQKEFNIA